MVGYIKKNICIMQNSQFVHHVFNHYRLLDLIPDNNLLTDTFSVLRKIRQNAVILLLYSVHEIPIISDLSVTK
ncbi:hypothetical protein Psfp_03521 [Pelotomaculum sp. FP]|nr:hypothetical protein Psfp_03521 [Pelotomaculum sp. FP]